MSTTKPVRRFTRLSTNVKTNQSNTQTESVPKDMLFIMKELDIPTTTSKSQMTSTEQPKETGKRQSIITSEDATLMNGKENTASDANPKKKKRKKAKKKKSKDTTFIDRNGWEDKDQQAMEALEQQVETDPFEALLAQHVEQKTKLLGSSVQKVKFCHQWQHNGYCEKGDQCPWSHEVPPEIARTANSSTKPCQAFLVHGICPLGERCPWSHDIKPDETTEQRPLCRFFKSGSCGKGLWCPFSHNLKLEPCFFFTQRGYCHSGDACRFGHILPEGSNTLGPHSWTAFKPGTNEPVITATTTTTTIKNTSSQ